MTVSVVVVSYRRQAHLEAILAAWLAETPDVWLCDCSKDGFKTMLPVKVVRAWPDPGNKIRHAVSLMTQGDLVIKADDDLMPKPGFAKQFVDAHAKLDDAIYGIHGRRFLGPHYYGNTRMFGPGNAVGIIEVDFVGVITCTPRRYLPMDLRRCRNEVEDLYWQMECYPQVKKYVVATRNVHHFPESGDAERLCAPGPSRQIRQNYYHEWWVKNYAGKRKW